MAIICWTSLHDKHGLQKEQPWSMIRLFQTAEFRSKPHLILHKNLNRMINVPVNAPIYKWAYPPPKIFISFFRIHLTILLVPTPSPCNVSLSKPLLRKNRFRASIEGFLSSIMGYLLFVVLTLLVTWGRSFQPLRAPQPRFPYVCLCNPCQSLSANQLSPGKAASNI